MSARGSHGNVGHAMTTQSPTTLPEDTMAPTMAYLHTDIPPQMTVAEWRRANKRPTRHPLFNMRRKARRAHATLSFDELLREEMS
jgi:hypothetical protein